MQILEPWQNIPSLALYNNTTKPIAIATPPPLPCDTTRKVELSLAKLRERGDGVRTDGGNARLLNLVASAETLAYLILRLK